MKKAICLLLFTSLTCFADALPEDQKKEVALDMFLKSLSTERLVQNGYTVDKESVDISYNYNKLAYFIPVVGQVAALNYYGAEGNQDFDAFRVSYSDQDGNQYLVECDLTTKQWKETIYSTPEITQKDKITLGLFDCHDDNSEDHSFSDWDLDMASLGDAKYQWGNKLTRLRTLDASQVKSPASN